MSDEKLGLDLGEWMKEAEFAPPDSRRSAHQVATRLPTTRQLGRWRWLPSFQRTAPTAPTADQTTAYQPTSIPASNGHSATVPGRTQSMFSPAKAITAGALVFAIGGAFLIAQPFDQQGSVPGAETEAIDPTWVTGEHALAPSCTGPVIEFEDDVRRERNRVCSPQTWTFSDPRLSGEVAAVWNEDIYQTDEGAITVHVRADFLRNDGGEWTCSHTVLDEGISQTGTTSTCVGHGGYDGLSAVLETDASGRTWVGLIFAGDFPPLPEPPAAE